MIFEDGPRKEARVWAVDGRKEYVIAFTLIHMRAEELIMETTLETAFHASKSWIGDLDWSQNAMLVTGGKKSGYVSSMEQN